MTLAPPATPTDDDIDTAEADLVVPPELKDAPGDPLRLPLLTGALMPAFGSRSTTNLNQCHPDLRVLFHEVIRTQDCAVICGERGRAEQETAFHRGKSKLRWPRSNHNVDGAERKTSWAADVVPWPLDWGNQQGFVAFADVVIDTAARLLREGRMNYEIRWGGDWDRDGEWKDERFVDMPHFELLGVNRGE